MMCLGNEFCVFHANLSTLNLQETAPVSFKLLSDSSGRNTNGFLYRSKTSKSGCHELSGLRQSRCGGGVGAARGLNFSRGLLAGTLIRAMILPLSHCNS